MKTENSLNRIKSKYIQPNIKCIKLDNQISLAMESDPPSGPGEDLKVCTPEYMKQDPFRNGLT